MARRKIGKSLTRQFDGSCTLNMGQIALKQFEGIVQNGANSHMGEKENFDPSALDSKNLERKLYQAQARMNS